MIRHCPHEDIRSEIQTAKAHGRLEEGSGDFVLNRDSLTIYKSNMPLYYAFIIKKEFNKK
jgi:hypothetical protein